jgi:DNA-binding response OmpR family regulator
MIMKKKVLLVDQNEAISFLITTLLEKDFDTCRVKDSYYAIKELTSGKPFDIIIVSIESKHDENFQLLQHIKSSSLLKNIKLLVLAGPDNVELERECDLLKIGAYIEKPFDPLLFTQTIRCLMPAQQVIKEEKKHVKIFNLNFYF